MSYYLLLGTTVLQVDFKAWLAAPAEQRWGRVGWDEFPYGIRVSTVFLGIDHGYPPNPKCPLVFETMAFVNGKDLLQARTSSWKEARATHDTTVQKALKVLPWWARAWVRLQQLFS